MKKFILSNLFIVWAVIANAQTASFTLTTTPCHNDGVLTANFTGLTTPMTVTWETFGTSGTSIVHSGVMSLADALTSYSGGPVYVNATDGTNSAFSYYAGIPPFTYYITAAPAVCPVLGTVNATVAGGTSPYTYQWYDPATMATVGTSNPMSLPPGSYGVTITDAAGCVFGSMVNTDSAFLYPMSPFTVSVTGTTASCTNGTAALAPLVGGTAPYSYLWTNGATTSSLSGLTMGYYSVTVTDALGCSSAGSVYIDQSITITSPVTPTPATCIATDGAVITFPSGGVPPYTFVWNNGATTASQTGLAAGSYSVNVTDANGCLGSGYGYVSTSTPITVTYASSTSLCTSATGSATLTIAGGTTPYTVAWYTSPPQTGVTATALSAGDYLFHVTDAAGCLQSGYATVSPVDVITAAVSATGALCTTATGNASVAPSGGVSPYTYSWSTGATSSGISSVPGGGYSVNIADAMGCHLVKSVYVPIFSPLSVGLSSTPASCIFNNDGSITATPAGGTSPYTYSWSNGGTTGTISGLPYGPYFVRVTDAGGCTTDWLYNSLGYDPAGTSCYCTISGTVYHDVNNNCTQDPGEPGIPNIQIRVSGGMGYTYTDAAGHYSMKVPSGSYTVSETILAFYPLSSCQLNNIPVTAVASSGCVLNVDFANAIDPIHDTHISTWNYNFPVPGHTYYQVSVVSNEGTLPEAGVLSGYKPDGQLLSPVFVPSGIFSGAPYYYNTAAGFPTLNPGLSQMFYMDYSVPTDIPLGTNVVFKDTVAYAAPMTNWLTDYSPWNNVRYFNAVTVSSYDPNFKEVSPKGTGPNGIISYSDSVLEYMVHFQNTGTYQAENVVVIDTLDNNLDWTSLRPVYQSSACQVSLKQAGSAKVAIFTFNNINLPASAYEPVRSNGMFTYTIKTKPGLPVGTQFRNNASIYFDFNAPVKTNTTLNTLGAVLGVNQVSQAAYNNSFTIYPNPANQTFNALISSETETSAAMSVSDVTGKVLITKTIALQKGSQAITTDASKLSPGVYFVNLTENGKTQTSKLVIMK